METINDSSFVKEQYATTGNLRTRISIHSKYSTNPQGFGNWIFSQYRIAPAPGCWSLAAAPGKCGGAGIT